MRRKRADTALRRRPSLTPPLSTNTASAAVAQFIAKKRLCLPEPAVSTEVEQKNVYWEKGVGLKFVGSRV